MWDPQVLKQAAREDRPSVCPLCGSPKILASASLGDSRSGRAGTGATIHECPRCDLFFLDIAVDVDPRRWTEAEENESRNEGIWDYKGISHARLDLLTRYGVSGRRLLDVGCGRGHFVHAARANGWDAWGVDLDAEACAYATRRFGLRTVLTGSLDHPALSKDFDVVTLWNVIEQVASPLEFLNQAADRLKPNGLIVIRTGNARSWKFDRDRNRWLWFGLTRRAYFSPRSLREALSTSGFRSIDVIDCESTERPGWQPAPDISQTPLAEGVRAVTRSPAKLAKAGLYLKYLFRRMKGRWRHGRHYQTSVMTAVAVRSQGAS